MRIIDFDTNTLSIGLTKTQGGMYLALTLTASKEFKTDKGAIKWLAKRGYNSDGSRIGGC